MLHNAWTVSISRTLTHTHTFYVCVLCITHCTCRRTNLCNAYNLTMYTHTISFHFKRFSKHSNPKATSSTLFTITLYEITQHRSLRLKNRDKEPNWLMFSFSGKRMSEWVREREWEREWTKFTTLNRVYGDYWTCSCDVHFVNGGWIINFQIFLKRKSHENELLELFEFQYSAINIQQQY